jgi:hypothetical protein
MSTDDKTKTAADDPPPFLGSWRNVYMVVAGELAVIVVLFAALAWWAS